ncbi:MAG: porin [Rubrivivax sp.]|nr:porin [Rubrivivax sp.]
MKKSLLALAALTAFAGAASAQSSVTLFGLIDLSANNIKNGNQSQKLLSSNQLASNRLGFRGVEDLGGGLRAGFWLEGGMNNDEGTGTATGGGQNWQRRSTISLMGGFGEIRLGRDYTPTFWNHTIFDPFGTNGVGAVTNLMTMQGTTSVFNGGATTLVRANNSIGYFLPALGGVYGQVMVAAGEGAVGNKYLGGRLGYAGGPINIAVAYGKTEITPTRDQVGINVGASFNFGFMTLMAQGHKYEVDLVGGTNRDQTNWMVAATVPFGASTLKVSYGDASSNGTDRDATQIAVGYQYDLSKRTAIYATASRINNDGNAVTGARVAVGSGPALQSGGQTSTGYNLGVRHSF